MDDVDSSGIRALPKMESQQVIIQISVLFWPAASKGLKEALFLLQTLNKLILEMYQLLVALLLQILLSWVNAYGLRHGLEVDFIDRLETCQLCKAQLQLFGCRVEDVVQDQSGFSVQRVEKLLLRFLEGIV